MMKKRLIFLAFLFLTVISFSQNKNKAKVLAKNNIDTVKTYLFTNQNLKDSTLFTIEYLNIKGYRTKVELFDSLENVVKTYEYRYRFDSLKTVFLTFANNELQSKTIFIYDRNNKKSRSIVYYKNQTENYTEYVFGKGEKVREVKEYQNKKLALLTEYRYFSYGALKEKEIKYPKLKRSITRFKKVRYKVELFEETQKKYENYKDSNQSMLKINKEFNRKASIPTIIGMKTFEKRDELKTKIFYLQNGLIDYVIQYKNDRFLAKLIYAY